MILKTNCKPQKILSGDRISIPKEAFKELKLKVGDWVLVEVKDNYLKVTPAKVVPR